MRYIFFLRYVKRQGNYKIKGKKGEGIKEQKNDDMERMWRYEVIRLFEFYIKYRSEVDKIQD